MKTSLLILTLLIGLTVHCQNLRLQSIIDSTEIIEESLNPNRDLHRGIHPKSFEIVKVQQQRDAINSLSGLIEDLNNLNADSLSKQERITRSVLELKLNNHVSEFHFHRYLIPFNAEGGFYNEPVFFLKNLPFESLEDYKAYLNWLPSFITYIEYKDDLMLEGISKGILPPKIIVLNNIDLMKPWINSNIDEHPLMAPFQHIPSSLSKEEVLNIRTEANLLLQTKIIPAYLSLLSFTQTQYLDACPNEVGISNIPNGKEYYENRVAHFTTLSINPDSIYNLGLAEVNRIQNLIDSIIISLEYDGNYSDFIQFLRTDSQFYANSAEELLNKAAWISKKAEGQLPKLFSNLYSLPFTVEPVPDEIAPTYTAGRFVSGSREYNRPGIYWVNTFDLKSRTLYTLPALTLHEAVPGHHLQHAIADEIEDVPSFRNTYYISAYGEGWGLYSEYLGEEMGIYTTPYEWFGRYTYEMWRACRLVVDVGIHYKGWTKEQAVEYMSGHTALSTREVNSEINRYIGWPGQALSYKMGELTIISLRNQAKKELGKNFDIQKFHHLILKNGSVPLPVLTDVIEEYLNEDF